MVLLCNRSKNFTTKTFGRFIANKVTALDDIQLNSSKRPVIVLLAMNITYVLLLGWCEPNREKIISTLELS